MPGPSSATEMTGLPSLLGNGHLSSGASVLDRIVDQIGDGIEQEVAIPGDQHLAIAGQCEAGGVLLGGGVVQLDDLARDLDQVHGAKRALARLGLDLRDARDRSEDPSTESRSAMVSPISA